MRKALYIASSICAASLLLFAFQRCTDDPPVAPPPGAGDTLSVTVDSATTTSLTLRLHANSAGEYRLDRDGAAIWSGMISPPDTVFSDENLLPSTEYQYALSHIVDGNAVSVSPVTTACTKDSASHEFIWEVDTLFRPGTNDPAFFTAEAIYATSATNVYMVGYSTGQERCWHWDGETWRVLNLGPALGGHIIDVDGLDSSYIVFASWYHGTHVNTGIITYEDGSITMLPWPKGDRNHRTCVHVAARDEIYLGSVQGVQRYNGSEWEWLLDSTETTGNEFYPKYIYKFPDGTLEMVTQRNDASRGTNFVRWRWEMDHFADIDSFYYNIPEIHFIRFGYRLHESENDVFSTGKDGTFIRRGKNWVRIHDEGGYYVAGQQNNLIIGQGWTNFWHYNGSTMKNLWGEMQQQVPGFRRINAMTFVDGVLFVCGEISPTIRDVVVLRGRQVENE